MGKFLYGSPPEQFTMDDRALMHLQMVIFAKLRRGESFPFTLEFDASSGGGRSSVWISPATAMHFRFEGGHRPSVNKAWLEALMVLANTPDGLRVLPEPAETGPVPVIPSTHVQH